MSRNWKIALVAVAVVVVLVVGLRMFGGSDAQSPRDGQGQGQGQESPEDAGPVPVTVESVVRKDVPVYLTALGTVSALNTVTINPQVGGRLVSLNFREGQAVKKGDLLAQIDPRELQAAYDQAAASKRQNQALLATARSTNARLTDPKYSQYVARTDLDTQRNLVSQYEAGVSAADAAMRAAQVQLQYTRITSPIDGIAGIRGVDVGNIVSTASSIVTITQVQPIYVDFSLPEKHLDAVRQAAAAGTPEVAALDRTDAHPLEEGGALDVVDNQVSSDSGTFRLRARFENADTALWPGQFVNVRLKVSTLGDALVAPTQAVQRGPDGDYVYVVQADNTVRMQTVATGTEVGDTHVVVTQGLKPGDRVVTEGQFRLKPGARVTALKPGEVPAAPTAEELQQAMKAKRESGARRGPPR